MNKRSYSLLKLGVIGLFRGSRKLQKAVLILAVLAFLTSLLPVIMRPPCAKPPKKIYPLQ